MPDEVDWDNVMQLYNQGRGLLHRHERAAIEAARTKFEEAFAQSNESYANALGDIGYTHLVSYLEVWGDPDEELGQAFSRAKRALDMSPADDYYNRWGYAMVLHAKAGDARAKGSETESVALLGSAASHYEQARQLNDADPGFLVMHADFMTYMGRDNALMAVDQILRAIGMNTGHPQWYFWSLGAAHFHSRQYDQAAAVLSNMLEPDPRVHLNLAASYARLSEAVKGSESDEFLRLASDALGKFRERTPDWTLDREMKEWFAVPEDRQHWLDAVQKAMDVKPPAP